MSKEMLPDDTIRMSLEHAVNFAEKILPVLREAVDWVRDDVARIPLGAKRHLESERQLAPAFVRLRIHQLIEGHNQRCMKDGLSAIQRKHVRNGAVCLLCADTEFRLLKASRRHPTRPSGQYQEALINQTRYAQMARNAQIPGLESEPLLNGLIYYQMVNLELRGAYVVIPNGFVDNRVNQVAQQQLDVFAHLEEMARFEDTGVLEVLQGNGAMIVGEGPVPNLVEEYDPHADSEEPAVDTTGDEEHAQPSVLEVEEVGDEE